MRLHTRNILAAALLAFPFASVAQAQESFLGIVGGDAWKVNIVSDSGKYAELKGVIDIESAPEIAPQHSSCILPVLETANRTYSYAFSPIYVDGRTRAKAVDRLAVLSGVQRPESSVIIRSDAHESPVDYVSRIPYSPDMLGARLVFYELVSGCAECVEHEDSLIVGGVLERYAPEWAFAPTPAGDDKMRSFTQRADLKFMINRYDIRPDFSGNAEILEVVLSSVEAASDPSVFTIHGIRFTGYASPDGPEEFNRSLALNRAESLAEYVKSQIPGLSDNLVSVSSIGEDWEGLFAAVAADPEVAGNATLEAIRSRLNSSNGSECEKMFKGDSGLYDYLRENILPSLRRTEYTIEYSIRDFSAEEAARLWNERPELLSVDEFKAAAEFYGKDSPIYMQILLAAVKAYPDDLAALQTAALALREAGKAEDAVLLLNGRAEPVLLNTLGILKAETGDYDAARHAFQTAVEAGSAEAGHNLEELEKVMFQL